VKATWRRALAVRAGRSPRRDRRQPGEYQAVDAILGYYGKLFDLSDGTFAAELQNVRSEGDDTVVATHRDTARAN
jgi:hypothetical protein